MEYLIDTHVCLWAIANKKKLSEKVSTILEDASVKIFVSQVSLFEIAIKLNIGKLPEFETSLQQFMDSVTATGFEILPVKEEHLIRYTAFEFSPEHRDPFDRYLIATAEFEKLSMITKDEKFKAYTDRLNIVW
jgi:PIN domain nuclease of toxin-antitoxin system